MPSLLPPMDSRFLYKWLLSSFNLPAGVSFSRKGSISPADGGAMKRFLFSGNLQAHKTAAVFRKRFFVAHNNQSIFAFIDRIDQLRFAFARMPSDQVVGNLNFERD